MKLPALFALAYLLDRHPREQHLPTVADRHHPRRQVHVHPHVLGRIQPRLTRMHTNPDPDRPLLKRRD